VRVNLFEIRPEKNLAAGEQQPDTAGFRGLIQDADQLIRAEFLGMGVKVRREQVVVAVPAAVVAAPGQFDRAGERHAPAADALLDAEAPG